jgi:UDP-N-acetylmuramate dehydrogenase
MVKTGMRKSNRGVLEEIVRGISGAVRFDEPLSRHTSLRIGGPADVLAEPESLADLRELVIRTHEAEVPLLVLGGTNLLVRDGGIRGVVIKLSGLQSLRVVGESALDAEGGAPMPKAARFAARQGLTGLEFGLGIPGTVGGAVVMNAGVAEETISGLLSSVQVLTPDGTIRDLGRSEIDFGYRWSRLPRGIVVSARLSLRKGRKEQIQKTMQRFLDYRRETQPLQSPSAGSVFKNPEGTFAAKLIESVGLKGRREGDAEVSRQHANFIVNRGRATARDVMRLIGTIGRKVEAEAGVTLELELKIVGTDRR